MSRGRNTFEDYQQVKQESREQLIVQCLAKIHSSRAPFLYLTDLADAVARYIALQEQRPCNKATLLRNIRYRSHLLTFMSAHTKAGTKTFDVKELADGKSRALVTAAQVEVGNLRRESDRLKAYISQLERQLGAAQEPGQLNLQEDAAKASQSLYEMQLKYTRTCQALFSVLCHLSQTLSTDPEHQRIVDLSRLRNNIVVDSAIAAPFFDWLAANKDLG